MSDPRFPNGYPGGGGNALANNAPRLPSIDQEPMRESTVGTIGVPGIPTESPATIYRCAERPIRIVIRNTGGSTLRLSHDSAALTNLTSGDVNHFQLVAGDEDTFILAPKQGIFAVSVGAGGQLSYAASDALPLPLLARKPY